MNYDSREALVRLPIIEGRASSGNALYLPPFAEVYVLVIAAPLQSNGNPRGIGAESLGNYAVISLGDPFDFVAHEIGHTIGFSDSFDNTSIKYDPTGLNGKYGHPYCVMSAQIWSA